MRFNMEKKSMKLDNLPDEILLFILKKLHHVEVLYSLIGVNKRLSQIAYDSIFTSHLQLYSWNQSVRSLPDAMLDQFQSQILPEIGHKIKWLSLEATTMDRILVRNYPNLNGLGLYGIDFNNAVSLLTELHIYVHHFTDLLYLLDGRFNQLHTLDVKEKLNNLKCFSLCSDKRVLCYESLVVPFLQRMLNLEKLHLDLRIECFKGFLNGHDFKEKIINYMPRLNEFTFNIRLYSQISNQHTLLSNEDIQNTFKDFKFNPIISCVDFFEQNEGYCHIYSYPYRLDYYDKISNNFPGGLFKYVYTVSLYDEYPFEYEFFLKIAQSFPFMKKLSIDNRKAQKNKFNNDNQDLSIKYTHLVELDLLQAHDDYIRLFLFDPNVSLPINVHLSVDYDAIKRVTENFTRMNCKKFQSLYIDAKEITQYIRGYFSQTTIF
ncbi:hypothetical protein I4U23_000285 [Adineta vaga]|nr:hypothetical protein I4U23_000285 [Adineta vaga]